jgi:hypothetical protein
MTASGNYRGKQDKYIILSNDSNLKIHEYDDPTTKSLMKTKEYTLFDSLLEARLFVYLKSQLRIKSITVHPKYSLTIGILTKVYKPDYFVNTDKRNQEIWEAKGLVLTDYMIKLSCLFDTLNESTYHLVFADKASLEKGFKKQDLRTIYKKVNNYKSGIKSLLPDDRKFRVYTLRLTTGLREYNPLTMDLIDS